MAKRCIDCMWWERCDDEDIVGICRGAPPSQHVGVNHPAQYPLVREDEIACRNFDENTRSA